MSRKRKKDGLKSKVLEFEFLNDENGDPDYIPYCEYPRHRGIVLAPDVCERRHCEYYRKLYIGSVGRL